MIRTKITDRWMCTPDEIRWHLSCLPSHSKHLLHILHIPDDYGCSKQGFFFLLYLVFIITIHIRNRHLIRDCLAYPRTSHVTFKLKSVSICIVCTSFAHIFYSFRLYCVKVCGSGVFFRPYILFIFTLFL